MVGKYLAVPEEVEAIQFSTSVLSEIVAFTECTNFELSRKGDAYQLLLTINGTKYLVIETNYIVKKANGDFKIYPKSEFDSLYIIKE